MKKFITLLLAMAGMVSTASAWNYLKGTFNNWTASYEYCLDRGPVAVYLTASETAYQFKIDAGTWYGATTNDEITGKFTTSEFNTQDGSSNFKMKVSTSGYYVFNVTWSNNWPTLTVRYPDTMVYFYNALGWTNVYLHDGWWNGEKGACNKNALRGVAMTVGANNIYSAYIPSEGITRVTFTSDKQINLTDNEDEGYGAGYANFYNTKVVWNADAFNSSKPLYIPTTTVSETLNEGTCSYYYGGSWYAYPTYTRNVTSGNFGTLCLPFDATVEGATVFKIVSKTVNSNSELTGINLESVESIEAGKPYIFKATGSELSATYTGTTYLATPIDAFAMTGNLSSTPIYSIAEGSYIVQGTNICKVVVGDGQSETYVDVPQYKAYITASGLAGLTTANARSAYFMGIDDESTGIESLQNENNQKSTVYNLQGQRVMDSQKGLLIVNGKKMIRK